MRLSEKTYRIIREKIITLELAPLSVINEQELSDDLGVGRTPIREALQRLASEDLVIDIPRRGMLVAGIGITDLQRIYEMRMVLEGLCARLAARRITDEQLAQLEAVIRDLEQTPAEDSRALMAIDERFHELLHLAADNEFLAQPLRKLLALSFRIWHLFLEHLTSAEERTEQYSEIVEAIKAGDEDRAEASLQQHVGTFEKRVRDLL